MSLYEMRNTVAGRVAGTLAAFALVVSLSFGGALNAQAQTAEELQAQIAQLTALIAQLQAQIAGGTTSTPAGLEGYVFTRNLTPGSTGADVTMLQKFLNANGAPVATVGAGSPGNETAFYGPATGAAVKAYQEMHRAEILAPLGLTVGTVNFGSSTRAYVNAQLASGTPTTPTTPGTGSGDLSGGEGVLEVDAFGSASLDVSFGDTDVIYEFAVEAVDSDIAVNRVDVMFTGWNTDTDVAYHARPWLYFDEVRLLADGKEVGSLSRSSDYTRSGDAYRARFSGLDVVVREDSEVEFSVEVDVLDSVRDDYFPGGDSDDFAFVVEVLDQGVRGVDGAGLVQYNTGDAGETVVGFDEAAAGDLRVRLSNDNPRAQTFDEDSRDTTLLSFVLDARDADITAYSVFVDVNDNDNNVLTRLTVMDGNTRLGDARVTGTPTGLEIELGRRGFEVREGRTVTLDLVAEFDQDKAGDVQVDLVDVEAEDEDYLDRSWTGTLSSADHKFVNSEAFSAVKEDEGYRSPTDNVPGRIDLEFTVRASDTADVDVSIADITHTLTGVSNPGNVEIWHDGELLAVTGNDDTFVVSRGTEETFTFSAYFEGLTGTANLRITAIDGNTVDLSARGN